MKCPKCGAKMGVIASAAHGDYVVRRRRNCLNKTCGHRLTTEEREWAGPAALTEEQRKAAAEKALEMAAARMRRTAEARRQIENRRIALDLGLNPEDLENE